VAQLLERAPLDLALLLFGADTAVALLVSAHAQEP
jgi:hypothetical protein